MKSCGRLNGLKSSGKVHFVAFICMTGMILRVDFGLIDSILWCLWFMACILWNFAISTEKPKLKLPLFYHDIWIHNESKSRYIRGKGVFLIEIDYLIVVKRESIGYNRIRKISLTHNKNRLGKILFIAVSHRLKRNIVWLIFLNVSSVRKLTVYRRQKFHFFFKTTFMVAFILTVSV